MEFDVTKVMIDAIKGVNFENYSAAQTSEAIRNALIEMNGGSTKITPKNFYRGSELYTLVEELIPVIIDEGFKDDDPIFSLVEYRNIAEGDLQEFIVEADSLFLVADAAAGTRGVRRQRINNQQALTIKTSLKEVRIYEELSRLMAGKVTMEKFVEIVATSFKQKILTDVYKAISEISQETTGLSSDYVVASSGNNETALLTLIEHVEAATGKTARIYGTKTALRKISSELTWTGDPVNSDMYEVGYVGKFYGTETYAMRQLHKPGTSTFALDDSKVYVIAGDDKPVKVVNEGEGLLYDSDAYDRIDLTQEYVYGQAFGIGVICAEKFGILTLA